MFDNMKIGKLAQTGDPGGLPIFLLLIFSCRWLDLADFYKEVYLNTKIWSRICQNKSKWVAIPHMFSKIKFYIELGPRPRQQQSTLSQSHQQPCGAGAGRLLHFYTLIIKKWRKKNSDFCLWCCNSLKSAPKQFNYFQTFFSFIENEFCFDDVLLFILLLNFWRYIKLIIQNFIWKNKIENDFFFYFRQFSIFISFDIMIMHMNLKFNFNG